MTTACIARILRVSFLFAGWTGFLLTAVSCGGSDIDIPDSYGQTAPDRILTRIRTRTRILIQTRIRSRSR